MPQGYMPQFMQECRSEQVRVLFKEIRIAVIGVNGASGTATVEERQG
jgi:hypothetical protein